MEDPPEESKLTLLNEVWKVVMKLKDPAVGVLSKVQLLLGVIVRGYS